MTTTLYCPAPYTKFSSQGYDIVQAGTAVPDGLVGAIVAQAYIAGLNLTTSAGGTAFVQSGRSYSPGTGAPTGDNFPVGWEVVDSTGAPFEKKADGTWVAGASGGGGGAVASVAGKTGTVTLVKADVGLGNVDNTADTAKPVSTAQAAADALALAKASNLSDLASAATARTNLGLGTAATQPTSAFDAAGAAAAAQAAATAASAPLASPALTGTPTAPTATAGDSSTAIATTAFVQGALGTVTKRVQAVMGGPASVGGSTITAGNGLSPRLLNILPVRPTRYRVRIRNYNASAQTTQGAFTLTACAISKPVYPTTGDGRWAGATTSPVSLSTPVTAIDGTATDTVTAWQTNAGEIDAKVPFVVAFGAQNDTGATVAVTSDPTGGLTFINSGAQLAANVIANTPIGSLGKQAYFDVRLEYEYNTTVVNGKPAVPVGLFIGDSITQGLTNDVGITGSSTILQHENWVGQSSLARSFAPINLGIQQKTAANFVALWSGFTTSRVDLTTTVPDFAVVSLGTNDIAGGATASTLQGNLATIVANLRTLGIPRIYLANIVPAGWANPISTTATTTSGSAVLTAIPSTFGMVQGMTLTGTGIPASTTILSVDGPNQVTMSANATATGTAVAVTVDKPAANFYTTAAKEAVRQAVNQWISKNPLGVTGTFDLDKAIRMETQPGMAENQMISVYPHPDLRGYTRMAQAVAV